MSDNTSTPILQPVEKEKRLSQAEIAKTVAVLLSSKTKTEAAARLEISRPTLNYRIETYGLGVLIDSIPQEAVANLKMMSLRATEVLGEVMEIKDWGLKMNAAESVLDRVGISKNAPANVQVNVANIIQKQKEEYNLDE